MENLEANSCAWATKKSSPRAPSSSGSTREKPDVSIPLPNLDDRRWSDLVEQGRALIPLYAPEWTDHNASDPGVTLMELLAWIAEGDLYRLNRITTRQKRRLLQLLHIRSEPPRPATVVGELRITGTGSAALPDAIEFAGQTLNGEPLAFRSTKPLQVAATELRAVQQRRDANGYRDATAAWLRQDAVPAFGDDPVPGAELYLGFEQPLAAGVWTSLYFIVAGAKARLDERRRILEASHATSLPAHHSTRLAWEYFAAAGGAGRWLPLDVDEDTRSFTLSGAVRVRPGSAMKAQALGQVTRSLFYVRCRFAAGAFDEAPRLERIFVNALELVQATAVGQTWPIAPGAVIWGTPVPGQLAGLHLEMQQGAIVKMTVDPSPAGDPTFRILGYTAPTASVPGTLLVQAALAGVGTGEPEQTITIGPRPIVEPSFRLFSLEGTAWRAWTRVDDFAASTRSSAHFLLDPTTGDVTFGDGEKGRVPHAGRLLVAMYDATVADRETGRVTAVADSPLNRVRLPDPTVIGKLTVAQQTVLEDGAAAEALAHAIGRAIESREASLRAVTVGDFESLAEDTPGTRIARVAVRPNLYPGLDCVSAPGIVTVVVVPSLPVARPAPSAGLIAEVTRRLEPRRTIGTRIIVTGPGYLEVAVRARIKAFDAADTTRLRRNIADALDAFFHPLRGGPDRTGWPLGRDVFRAEVMQVIDETAGVDHVLSLELHVEGRGATCGNVCLRPTWLVAAGAHEIEVL
jgi:hypothetical protein